MKILELVTRTQISEALGWTLVHMLWQGAIIAAVLAALMLLVRSPRIRCIAASVALVAIVASFLFTLIYFLPNRAHGTQPLTKVKLPSLLARPDVSSDSSQPTNFDTLVPWLVPVWAIGVCIFYLRYAAGWLSLRTMRRGAHPASCAWQRTLKRLAVEMKLSRPVVLMESWLADAPAVFGHFRPVIVVPLGFLTGMPLHQVEAILLHELAHIRRADYLINVCQRLVEGLFFYHPAVWWISLVIRTERENCCDDMVVNLRRDLHAYAVALTALEENRLEQRWPAREPAIAATGGNLMKRVQRLLYPKPVSGFWAPAVAALLLITSTATAVAAWHVNSDSNPGSQQKEQQVDNPWQKWLNEDVVYIISEAERAAFERLTTDRERQQFVEQFWARRDPTPGTPENEFKEEHYRRIAYANDHFAGKMPGWKTDRGRIYIKYGPPDEIDSHRSKGSYNRPESEGGGSAVTYPFEDWRYRYIDGMGGVIIEFVDKSSSGEFRMTLDPHEKYEKP